jgi:hypothetical protein
MPKHPLRRALLNKRTVDDALPLPSPNELTHAISIGYGPSRAAGQRPRHGKHSSVALSPTYSQCRLGNAQTRRLQRE